MCTLYTIVRGHYEHVDAEAEHLLAEGHDVHRVPVFREKVYGDSSVLVARMVMKKELPFVEQNDGDDSLDSEEPIAYNGQPFELFDNLPPLQ